jgi:hypothetical protein
VTVAGFQNIELMPLPPAAEPAKDIPWYVVDCSRTANPPALAEVADASNAPVATAPSNVDVHDLMTSPPHFSGVREAFDALYYRNDPSCSIPSHSMQQTGLNVVHVRMLTECDT